MADITMCNGVGCLIRQNCYRFTAKPNKHWQSYFKVPVIDGKNCEYLIKNK